MQRHYTAGGQSTGLDPPAGLCRAAATVQQPVAGDTRPCLLSPVRRRMQSCRTRRHRQDPCGLSGFPAISRRHRTGHARSRTPPPGKRVLIIGTGPSGLSATYHVARLGHAAEIKQAGPVPGGKTHFGIPAYRLPLSQSDEGINRIDTALDRTRAHGLMAQARRAQRQDLAMARKPGACQSRRSIVCCQSCA